ncbi:MAG TPA: OsmC family protein [Terriglobales bacterium]|nr:OsmC family protein [Terriglobales bacterium]
MSSRKEKATADVLEPAPQAENIVNGVNVTALLQTVEAVKVNPVIAKFRFNLKNEWLGGAYSRSIINGFQGAMQDIERSQSFQLHADEPPILLGRDLGPNAGEYLLQALAACVTSTMIYHAAARGIVIEEVESKVEGEIDLRGFLGTDKSVRNGFQNIRMSFDICGDLSDQELQELAKLGPTFSPVLDSLTKGVPVTVQAQRMRKK